MTTTFTLADPALLKQQCYVDGKWINADDGASTEVRNKATGAVLGTVPRCGAAETRRAIAAAKAAFPAWAAKPAKERGKILRRLADLMVANTEDLGRLMTAEQGKPLAEAKGEVGYAASFYEWFGEEGRRVYGDLIPSAQADKRLFAMRQPVGVVGAITRGTSRPR